ncbi:MAG: hypothetical protein ACREE1_11275 [Stellaceae bacterium]
MKQESPDASQKFDTKAKRLRESIAMLRDLCQTRALLGYRQRRLIEDRKILYAEISFHLDDLHSLRERLSEIEKRMKKSAFRSNEPAADRERGGSG